MTDPARSRDILLVEDSPTDRLIVLRALRIATASSRVHFVEDGVEAMAYLRKERRFELSPRPDLILLDLNLPRKDGRQVLLEIKSDPALRCIPVVILTTSMAESDVAAAYAQHCNSYLTKQVDFSKFTRSMSVLANYWFEIVTLSR